MRTLVPYDFDYKRILKMKTVNCWIVGNYLMKNVIELLVEVLEDPVLFIWSIVAFNIIYSIFYYPILL